MKLLHIVLVSILFVEVFPMEDIEGAFCDCNHCSKIEKIILDQNESSNSHDVNIISKEDADGDGKLTICANDRDRGQRTFATVCHMLCYNRCTKFVIREVDDSLQKNITIMQRANYYKLRDGAC